MTDSFLTRHLRDANEHYFEHLAFTIRVGATLVVIAAVVVVHGVFPFLFTHTGSRMLARLNATMAKRRARCEATARK